MTHYFLPPFEPRTLCKSYDMSVVEAFAAPQQRSRDTEVLLSCSDEVTNITISPSSPLNRYKPSSKIAPIYLQKTVSSSWRQCKLLG